MLEKALAVLSLIALILTAIAVLDNLPPDHTWRKKVIVTSAVLLLLSVGGVFYLFYKNVGLTTTSISLHEFPAGVNDATIPVNLTPSPPDSTVIPTLPPDVTLQVVFEDKREKTDPDFRMLAVGFDSQTVYILVLFYSGLQSIGSADYLYLYGTHRDMIRLARNSFRLERDHAGDGLFEDIVYQSSPTAVTENSILLQIPIQSIPDIAEKKIWLYSMTSQDCIPDECAQVLNRVGHTPLPGLTTTSPSPLPLSTSTTPSPTLLTPSPPPSSGSWAACPDSPLSRLHVGDRAAVSDTPNLPNRVRSAPGKQNSIVGQINPGSPLLILDGPACADGWVWWKIKAEKENLTGWTVEGDSRAYWLVQCPIDGWCGKP